MKIPTLSLNGPSIKRTDPPDLMEANPKTQPTMATIHMLSGRFNIGFSILIPFFISNKKLCGSVYLVNLNQNFCINISNTCKDFSINQLWRKYNLTRKDMPKYSLFGDRKGYLKRLYTVRRKRLYIIFNSTTPSMV